MPRLAERHTLSKWTNDVIHIAFDGSSITDSATYLPPPGVVTASGARPTTAVRINYFGGDWNGNDRCERGIGMTSGNGLQMVEGGVYWADYWQRVETFANNGSQYHNDYSQVRDSGAPADPSPSPAWACYNGGALMLRNLWSRTTGTIGPTLPFPAGSMSIGTATWIHWQVGFKWTEGTTGWFQVWRNDVKTVDQTGIRTARETSGGASWRFGIYRDVNSFGDQDVEWYLWGLEIWNERPSSTTPPPVDPPPTTRPALPSPPEVAGRRFGNLPTASGQDWVASGNGKKRSTPPIPMPEGFTSSRLRVALRGTLTNVGSGTQQHIAGLYRIDDPADRSQDALIAVGTASVDFDDEAAWVAFDFPEGDFEAGYSWQITLLGGPDEVGQWGRNPVGGLIFSATDAYGDGLSSPFGPYTTDTVSLVAYIVADPVAAVVDIPLEGNSTAGTTSRGDLSYADPGDVFIDPDDVTWRIPEVAYTEVIVEAIALLSGTGFVVSLRPVPYSEVTGERLQLNADGTYSPYDSTEDPEP